MTVSQVGRSACLYKKVGREKVVVDFEIANTLQSKLLLEHAGYMSLPPETREAMRVVNLVFPFRINNYVLNQLIDWTLPQEDLRQDPLFRMTFPQREMLSEEHFQLLQSADKTGDQKLIGETVAKIRQALNPHPAGQMTTNVPKLSNGQALPGLQHKYPRTVLVFPRQGQTCHTYCTFCFRWPQFVGDQHLRIETGDINSLVQYLSEHPEVSDLLFTGGDPLVMPNVVLRRYVDALLKANLPHLTTIRFGTKALSYWPFRFTSDADSAELLQTLATITKAGKRVTVVAHFTHPREMHSAATRAAIKALHSIDIDIRTQTPLLRNINDRAEVLAELWQSQVSLGCIPYYLFVARDTGAQHYFAVPLAESHTLFRSALASCSGLAGTVRGPIMSADPGKIELLGVQEVANEKVFQLRFLQARVADWNGQLFQAKYDPKAIWLTDLKPALGASQFFFERQ